MDTGTFFGGMFKARNVIEAGILAAAIGFPVFYLPISLTARIIILCLTALPLALVALMGISGESLSSFILIFFVLLFFKSDLLYFTFDRIMLKVEVKQVLKNLSWKATLG